MKQKELKKLIKSIFIRHGLNKNHAEISSNYIIKAELIGASSHGLSRLKMYCDRIKKKLINPKPKIKIKLNSKSISHIDANNSIGFVSADIAIKKAISNCRKTGIGLVGVKNSGHYGLSSFYAEQAVKENLVVLCFTNAPPAIAPHGSKKKLFGTNPICFGTPTGSKIPFILDTSVSMINRGKIRVAAKQGLSIPKNVALDKFGKPTTDANKALKGVQLPMAGFRGSGLAWMVDILSGVFTGGNHGGKVKDPFDNFSGPQNVGHLFIVMKSNIFVGSAYNKKIKENIKAIKKLPKIKGIKKIFFPGENKYLKYKKNYNNKIIIPKHIIKDIKKLNT